MSLKWRSTMKLMPTLEPPSSPASARKMTSRSSGTANRFSISIVIRPETTCGLRGKRHRGEHGRGAQRETNFLSVHRRDYTLVRQTSLHGVEVRQLLELPKSFAHFFLRQPKQPVDAEVFDGE